MVVTNLMVRMPTLVSFVVLSLLFASGAAAAAPTSSSGELETSYDQTSQLDESYEMNAQTEAQGSADGDVDTNIADELPCPPDEMCTPSQDDEGERQLDGEVHLTSEIRVDVDLLDEVELPEDQPEPSEDGEPEQDEEQATQEEQNTSEETQQRSEIKSYGDTRGTIDHNASSSATTYVEGEHDPSVPPEPTAEPEQEENTSDEPGSDDSSEEGEHEERVDVREVSAFLEARSEEDLDASLIAEDRIDTKNEVPLEQEIEAGDDGSFSLDLSSRFKASTQGMTSAYGQLTDNVKQLVGKVKGALSGAGSTETVVDTSTQVEAADHVAGEAGVAGEVTSDVTSDAVEQVQVPDVQPPTADVSSQTDARSSTQVSSDATGDLGLDL